MKIFNYVVGFTIQNFGRAGGGGGEGIESVGCPALNILHATNTVHQNAAQPFPQVM